MCVCVKLFQACPTLCCPMDCSLPGSSVHGILQARILEWVAIPSSRGSFPPRDRTHISCDFCSAGRFFNHQATGSPLLMHTQLLFSISFAPFLSSTRPYNVWSLLLHLRFSLLYLNHNFIYTITYMLMISTSAIPP